MIPFPTLRLAFSALLALSSTPLLALEAPKVVPLWSGAAPGAKGERPEDTPRLDVYCPQGEPCGAAVVICPGGGYGGLAADHEGKQIAQFYNSLGVTAFVLHYRLGTQGYHYPIQLQDVNRAIRWVRDHTEEYNLDAHRIGLTGFSAGGHLASMGGTLFDKGNPEAPDQVERASSRPDFLVLGYPVISLSDSFTHVGSRNNLFGPDKKDDAELAKKLSSQLNVTADTPPTFIFQTDKDTVVPAENAVAFYLALRQHKVPAELHIYQDGPHGVGLMHGDPVLSTWGTHLRDWLRNNGWLRLTKRAAIAGTITVQGKPVSWGSITFRPEDKLAPVVSARVMNGKFSAPAAHGVPLGKHRLELHYSAADLPDPDALETPEGIVRTNRLDPANAEPIIAEIKEGSNTINLDLKAPTKAKP